MSKKPKLAGNAMIGQSGGPTMVINQSLVGAVLEARRFPQFGKMYGALHGVRGILDKRFVDLTRESAAHLERVAETPSAALGSVRMKPTEADCEAMFGVMRKLDVRYFFYIGGNDSAETARILCQVSETEGYDLHVFHIPKTIDNDLLVTDHCPGYGSAARFVAQVFMGDDLDTRSLPGIKINIVMGRNAGFLTAASALGRIPPEGGPHLVYVPEVPFDPDRFARDVERKYAQYGRCLIAASEGLQSADGVVISKKIEAEVDAFGNRQLSGSGQLGDYMADLIKTRLGKKVRVRADTLGYMQRAFIGNVSKTDSAEARRVGLEAVRLAAKGIQSGSIVILRAPGRGYKVRYDCVPLEAVAKLSRKMPREFMNEAGNDVTKAFLRYAAPLVGPLPEVAFLKAKRVSMK